ncbi:cytochrome P450 [Mycena sanguinolenta]|nr:cytochrome P450 [Mycena sanguinolenta]
MPPNSRNMPTTYMKLTSGVMSTMLPPRTGREDDHAALPLPQRHGLQEHIIRRYGRTLGVVFILPSSQEHHPKYTWTSFSIVDIWFDFKLLPIPASRTDLGPGHMLQLVFPPEYGDHEFVWQKAFGPVYRVKGCFGEDSLMISDPVAIQYIVTTLHFEHGPVLENVINMLFGKKSLVAAKACLGCSPQDLGEEFVANNAEIVCVAWLQCITRLPKLDSSALSSSQSAPHIFAIGASLPNWIWRAMIYAPLAAFKNIRTAKYLTHRLSEKIVRDKLDLARQGLAINTDVFGMLLEQYLRGKTKYAINPEGVAAQFSALVYAGQDPTANTIAFGLLELAKHPAFQEKLRAEIQSNIGASYDNMPLLNAFIKEILRLYPAAALIQRIVVHDAVIPLSDSIETATGELINQIPVRKGQVLTLAVASFQRLERYWGADSEKFRPSRWLDGTITHHGPALGPYAHLLSFLGGPRVCLGILEMQVFFTELQVKRRDLNVASAGAEIKHRSARHAGPELGHEQMPLVDFFPPRRILEVNPSCAIPRMQKWVWTTSCLLLVDPEESSRPSDGDTCRIQNSVENGQQNIF